MGEAPISWATRHVPFKGGGGFWQPLSIAITGVNIKANIHAVIKRGVEKVVGKLLSFAGIKTTQPPVNRGWVICF